MVYSAISILHFSFCSFVKFPFAYAASEYTAGLECIYFALIAVSNIFMVFLVYDILKELN